MAVMAALSAALAFSQPSTPLFSPMSLASIQRGPDPKLDALLDNRGTLSVQRVQVRAELIQQDTHELQFNLEPGVDVVAVRDAAEQIKNGLVTWSGRITSPTVPGNPSNDRDRTASLTRTGNELSGYVDVNGDEYLIVPLKTGGHALAKVDPLRYAASCEPR